ncbi:MAG: hypothetical protein JSW71_10330 [Gemmatimonadota bacterium]|nr:MAG: hypothetical protein JSW71_10330 [Gemmatimonadota bacterium]
MWRAACCSFASVLMAAPAVTVAQQKSIEQQIVEAVSPLPVGMRGAATVMAYADGDTLSVVRMGLNLMICLADDPKIYGFHAACYHRDLEPFMARGRMLQEQGKTIAETQQIRVEEIEAGKLPMPDHPAALYSLTGPEGGFDHVTGSAIAARGLHVIYVPYATERSIGISEVASSERPWLMYPGTPLAHIMIHIP